MKEYTLKNEHLVFSILDTGASITSIKYNNGHEFVETTMQYENMSLYENENPYFLNCIVGPHAGRIKDAKYSINDKIIMLEKSSSGNHLHGGSHGLHTLTYNVAQTEDSLVLRARDDHNKIDIILTYTLDGKKIRIKIEAIPDFEQVVNITQHTYFNLGTENTIHNHLLKVDARCVTALDETGVPMNLWLDVAGTPFDFFAKRRIGEALKMYHSQFSISNNIDHPFKTNNGMVSLEEETTKVGVNIKSDAEYTVIYAANYFDNHVLFKNRGPAFKHGGLAVEPQDLPNDVNIRSSRSQIYGKNNPFIRTIDYDFYTILP